MAIIGIRRLRYGVTDLETSARFFVDFGLYLQSQDNDGAILTLANGAVVELRPLGHPTLPATELKGPGVHEVVWGVDHEDSLQTLLADLTKDHAFEETIPGVHRFTPSFGIPMSLTVWHPNIPAAMPDPANAPGCIGRLNTHRKWRRHAIPKSFGHVVFKTPKYLEATNFMRSRLGFRLSDIQKNIGIYLRCDGNNNHHNLLFLNANAPLPGCDGTTAFEHANFTLEDIDELMIGVNNMLRRDWPESHIGLGRHRVDSGIFYYFDCPAGGEAEYGTDADYIDDNWVPRHFRVPLFGYAQWTHTIPDFLRNEPEWGFDYLTDDEIRTGVPLDRGI